MTLKQQPNWSDFLCLKLQKLLNFVLRCVFEVILFYFAQLFGDLRNDVGKSLEECRYGIIF